MLIVFSFTWCDTGTDYKYNFTYSVIPWHWFGASNSNSLSKNTYIITNMATDGLKTQAAIAWVGMVATWLTPMITRFMGSIWSPPGDDRTMVGPMLAPWSLLSGTWRPRHAWILIKMSLKFVPKVPINNIPALVQIMAWKRPVNKPLSEPIMANLLMHICTTLPQWINMTYPIARIPAARIAIWK